MVTSGCVLCKSIIPTSSLKPKSEGDHSVQEKSNHAVIIGCHLLSEGLCTFCDWGRHLLSRKKITQELAIGIPAILDLKLEKSLCGNDSANRSEVLCAYTFVILVAVLAQSTGVEIPKPADEGSGTYVKGVEVAEAAHDSSPSSPT